MTVRITPTQIKQSTYLLVPKNIADMIEIDENTIFLLTVKPNGKNHTLEYHIQ